MRKLIPPGLTSFCVSRTLSDITLEFANDKSCSEMTALTMSPILTSPSSLFISP